MSGHADTIRLSEDLSAGYHFAEVRSIARAALAGTPSEHTG